MHTYNCKIFCTCCYNFVIFDQTSIKLGTHVLPEVLNQIISSLLAQPTKKASYRDFSKNN